jgi:hypothetical protein
VRALSVRPPWAWAIAHADKRIENRSWRTSYRGPLAIHASQKFVGSEAAELERILGYELDPTMFKRGAFIAVADLVDVVKAEAIKPSPWLCGPYAWLLEDVRPLSAEVPASGKLGLWRPTQAQLRAIARRVDVSSGAVFRRIGTRQKAEPSESNTQNGRDGPCGYKGGLLVEGFGCGHSRHAVGNRSRGPTLCGRTEGLASGYIPSRKHRS